LLNPDAIDLVFQGSHFWNKGSTLEHMGQSRAFFERALTIDPDNIEALVGVAAVDAACGALFVVDDPQARFAAAETNLLKALSLAPQHARAHMFLGSVQMSTNRLRQGISECERALALNRNLAEAHASIGIAKVLIGRGTETEAHIQEALRLSPRDDGVHRWMHYVGFAKLILGADSEAVVWLRRCLEANRNNLVVHFHLAAALALIGTLDEAHAATQEGLALDPTFTILRARASARARTTSDDPAFRAGGRRILDGMRLAGVPEG
jgi:tetratricopeptide (TPR) repeat protein